MDNFTLTNQTADPNSIGMSGLHLTRDPLDMLLDDKSNCNNTDFGYSNRLYPKSESRRWPNGVVPYVIHESIEVCADSIMEAITHIEDASCVKFAKRTNETRYEMMYRYILYCDMPTNTYILYIPYKISYVNIHRNVGDNGCYAHVGHYNGLDIHLLHLGPNCCQMGVIAHEMLHSLGLDHEQNRPDRYVMYSTFAVIVHY